MAARMVADATEGFDVVGEAESGEDSVAMAAELTPDLVLMDVNLPGINGLDATRQILAGAGDGSNAVVVLLLSTYEEDEYAPRAAECGAAARSRKRYSARNASKLPGRRLRRRLIGWTATSERAGGCRPSRVEARTATCRGPRAPSRP